MNTALFLTMYSIALAVGVTSDRNLLWIRTQSLMKSSFSTSGKLFALYSWLGTTETIQAVIASVTRMLGVPGMEPRGAGRQSHRCSWRVCRSQFSWLQSREEKKKRKADHEFITSLKKWVSPYMVCRHFGAFNPVFAVVLSNVFLTSLSVLQNAFQKLFKSRISWNIWLTS